MTFVLLMIFFALLNISSSLSRIAKVIAPEPSEPIEQKDESDDRGRAAMEAAGGYPR